MSSLDAARLKRDLAQRVQHMVGFLGRHTAQARQALRRLLVDKIDIEPVVAADRRGYRLSGRLTYGRLLQGEATQVFQALGNSRWWWLQRDSNPCFSLERAVT